MSLKCEYTESVWMEISLKDDPVSPNYIWIEFSDLLIRFLKELNVVSFTGELVADFDMQRELRKRISQFFCDEAEVIYIPAGRSMITLLSTQLSYIYSSMVDSQRRNIDYCTQSYLERILQLKPHFHVGLSELVKNKKELTDQRINMELLDHALELVKQILKGKYRQAIVVSRDDRQSREHWAINPERKYDLRHYRLDNSPKPLVQFFEDLDIWKKSDMRLLKEN